MSLIRRMTKVEFETALANWLPLEYNPETAPHCLELSDGSVLFAEGGVDFRRLVTVDGKREVVGITLT